MRTAPCSLTHGQRLVVDEVGVLDAADPGRDGAGDRAAGVGVCGDVAVRRLGLLDHRLDLGERVLGGVDPVRGRGDAAARHDLDVVRALAQLVPRGGAYRGDPVGDAADARARRVVLVGDPTARARVAVATGLGERLAAEEHLRAGHQPFPLGVVDPVVRAADVTHGREAAAQHPVEDAGRPEGHIGGRELREQLRSAVTAVTCTWQSMSPGRTNFPVASRVATPGLGARWASDVDDPAVEDADVTVPPLARHDIEVAAAANEEAAALLAAIVVHGVKVLPGPAGSRQPDRPWADPRQSPRVRPCGAPARPPMRAGAPSASPDVTRTHAPSREIRDIPVGLPIV